MRAQLYRNLKIEYFDVVLRYTIFIFYRVKNRLKIRTKCVIDLGNIFYSIKYRTETFRKIEIALV